MLPECLTLELESSAEEQSELQNEMLAGESPEAGLDQELSSFIAALQEILTENLKQNPDLEGWQLTALAQLRSALAAIVNQFNRPLSTLDSKNPRPVDEILYLGFNFQPLIDSLFPAFGNAKLLPDIIIFLERKCDQLRAQLRQPEIDMNVILNEAYPEFQYLNEEIHKLCDQFGCHALNK